MKLKFPFSSFRGRCLPRSRNVGYKQTAWIWSGNQCNVPEIVSEYKYEGTRSTNWNNLL